MRYFSMKPRRKFLMYSTSLLAIRKLTQQTLTLALPFHVRRCRKTHFSPVSASPSTPTLFDTSFIETRTLSSSSSRKSSQSLQMCTCRSSLPSKSRSSSALGLRLKNATSDGASSLRLQLLGEGSASSRSMMSSQPTARSNSKEESSMIPF